MRVKKRSRSDAVDATDATDATDAANLGDAVDEDPYRQNLRQLLLRRSNWFEERMVEAAPRYGYTFITPGVNRLFAHMSRKPVSISELARRLAVSRQAAHQTAAEACRRGILELVDDPQDARVRMVKFTAEGLTMVRNAARARSRIENDLRRRLGERDFEALQRILERDW
jgi:DNA-binding MarR family transcriptional regulator